MVSHFTVFFLLSCMANLFQAVLPTMTIGNLTIVNFEGKNVELVTLNKHQDLLGEVVLLLIEYFLFFSGIGPR